MSERENIFARIREALSVAAPTPGAHGVGHAKPAKLPTPDDHRRVLPAVGSSFDERAAMFARNSSELKTDFKLFQNEAEMLAALKSLGAAEKWARVASHPSPLTDAACKSLGLPVLLTEPSYDATDLEKCPVGISECDALIAQTGSVLVTSRSAGGRALSVLPPHHLVIARREQLVAGLPDAFALLKTKYASNYPSMISLITGPSRTGDIERILVLGAHGPKRLTVFCY